jgi:hypothetical protein
MKIRGRLILIAVLFAHASLLHGQTIPEQSLYLGQITPGDTPKVFELPVSAQSFAAERIAISNDNKNIYFQELDGYAELDGQPHTQRIKYFTYMNGKWNGPEILFEGYGAPCFSLTEDTLYIQKERNWQTYYSVINSKGWGAPIPFSATMKYSHYVQVTKNGHYYVSSNPSNSVGGLDRSRIHMNGSDTTVTSLGIPLNSAGHDFDFFISRDESFMIVAMNKRLCISYQKKDGGWTNPKDLGKAINYGLASWGPYVTRDNKYLFFTAGTKPDYSDTYIHWVRIGNTVDSLKKTNYEPYLKNQIVHQTSILNHLWSYVVPDTTFMDDDGNNTLTYSAALSDGSPLPSWLHFHSATRTFTGTPSTSGSLKIKIKVIDTAQASAFCEFDIRIEE